MDKLPPPSTLSLEGNLKENWRRFSQAFEIYLIASGINEKSEKVKTNTLLHLVGQDAVEIYNTFEFEEAGDKSKLKPVLDKFEQYCNPRKNVIFERHVFNTRCQGASETIDSYVTDLRMKARSCEYGDLKDSLIRDRIVCGLKSDAVRSRLLRDSDLTLEKAIETCRAAESTETQMKIMTEGPSTTESVNAIQKKNKEKHKFKTKPVSQKEDYVTKVRNCKKCGRSHEARKCPAFGKECHKCHKSNHFAKMCRGHTIQKRPPKIHGINASDTESEYEINCVENNKNKDKDWNTTFSIGNKHIKLKLDTGAQVNVMPLHLYKKLSRHPMMKSKARLVSYSGHPIETCGKTSLTITHKGKFYIVDFQIVNSDVTPVLGLKSCQELNLVKRIYAVNNRKSSEEILNRFEDLFDGLGCLPGKHTIKIDKEVSPVVHAPRKVPFALKKKVKVELDKMEKQGVIEKVNEPTDWVNSMVVVEKPNKVRVVLDPRDLNRGVKREHFPMKTVDEVAAKVSGAKVFSTLDASSGFWTLKLDEESSKLTTFNTPFGRYKYLRMPMGISSAPEIFQRRISQLFEDVEGCDVIIDDIIVWGKDEKQHNKRLTRVLERAREINLKLNKSKCKIASTEVKYMGHIFSESGIRPDPEKINTINKMESPKNKKELQRFMGMVNYVGKFVQGLSCRNQPLRELLQKTVAWHWNEKHEQCFQDLKCMLTKAPFLKYFDVTKPVTLSVDASSEGLGACLMQDQQPVSYASKGLNQSEKNYSQIEKELFAIVFGCLKFHQYLYGKKVQVETDHKPLESLFRKPLYKAPPRIQRMMLRIQRYDLNVQYKQGKLMYVADTLSRATQKTEGDKDQFQVHTLNYLPITNGRLSDFKLYTEKDPSLQQLKETVLNGWPDTKAKLPDAVKPYWNFRDEIGVYDGLLTKNKRLIVPSTLQSEMLKQLHGSHLGIEKTKRRARDILYWPGMNGQIAELISKCGVCSALQKCQQKEPLIQHERPDRPWCKVAADLFELDGTIYIVMVDYYSNYFEVNKINNSTSSSVIKIMKEHMSRFGIINELVSDNGPCFASQEFANFAQKYNFKHTTSSPLYAQSNGLAEKTVQTVKKLLKKAKLDKKDPYLSILEFRNTPLDCGKSPVQLMMGRRTNTFMPINPALLKSEIVNDEFKDKQQKLYEKQKIYYDKNAKELEPLKTGEHVRVRQNKTWEPAEVVGKTSDPRSYIIKMDSENTLRRNRRDIRRTNETFDFKETSADDKMDCNDKIEMSVNRKSTRPIKPPRRFIEEC